MGIADSHHRTQAEAVLLLVAVEAHIWSSRLVHLLRRERVLCQPPLGSGSWTGGRLPCFQSAMLIH